MLSCQTQCCKGGEQWTIFLMYCVGKCVCGDFYFIIFLKEIFPLRLKMVSFGQKSTVTASDVDNAVLLFNFIFSTFCVEDAYVTYNMYIIKC